MIAMVNSPANSWGKEVVTENGKKRYYLANNGKRVGEAFCDAALTEWVADLKEYDRLKAENPGLGYDEICEMVDANKRK